ncbi:unnamed protein product, partial [Hapterophycus canaliculatus]
ISPVTARTCLPEPFPRTGEVACTGLHGANRLASTSLLEGLVWGCSIADHLADEGNADSRDGLAASADLAALAPPKVPGTVAGVDHPPATAPPPPRSRRTILWEDVGAVRRTPSLREGAQLLADLAERCGSLYETSPLSPETVELRNGAQTGAVIAAAAANNQSSLGTHFVEDAEDEGHEAANA